MSNPEAASKSIKGKPIGKGETIGDQVERVLAAGRSSIYEHKVFTLGVVADVDLATLTPDAPQGAQKLFELIERSHLTALRFDEDITIKLNSASNDPIPLSVLEGGIFEETHVEVTKIFITTTVATVLKVRLS